MRLLITLAVLGLSVCEVHAQVTPPCTAPCTKTQLLNDVQTQFPDNTVGAITPSILRNFQNNLINSSMATAPVGSGAFTCYVGTTGLLGACTAALGITLGGTGATTQPGAAAAIFPPPVRTGDIPYWSGSGWGTVPGNNTTTGFLQQTNTGAMTWVSGSTASSVALPTPTRAGDVVYWTGSSWLTLPGNNVGTQVLTENASGVPSWTAAGFPAATRAGDVIYWNGTAWVSFPGNNSGTQALTENATGVPAWSAFSTGTVTSIVAGTGLSGGTITTSGTVAINMPVFTASIPADVTLAAGFVDGPSVAQGTAGTWLAVGTVTMLDSSSGNFNCKLWDGTTVMAAGLAVGAAGAAVTMGLSGMIASPAGNIKISCKDAATGKILFNASANGGKDSTITVVRIQ